MRGDPDWRPSSERNAYKRNLTRGRGKRPLTTQLEREEALVNHREPSQRSLPYAHRPIVIAERIEREKLGVTPRDYGVRWRSAYSDMLGPSPRLRPGDHTGALGYLHRIRTALERGGWTPGEWGRLYRLRDKWEARAGGRSAVFEVIGNRSGSITPGERKLIQAIRVMLEMGEMATTWQSKSLD